MSIVRSLLIKIGFQTDKKAITNVNRSIESFKTRFAIAASAVSFALNKSLQFFDNLANSVIEARNFSKYLGESFKEVQQLQRAFKTFGINENQFTGAFDKLNQLIIDFKRGNGEDLIRLSRSLGFEITPNMKPIELLFRILEGLKGIPGEIDRIAVSTSIFGKEIASQISDVSQNIDGLVNIARQSESASKNLESSYDVFKEFTDSFNEVKNAIYDLSITIATKLLPFINPVLKVFSGLLKLWDGILTFNFSKVAEAAREVSKALDPIFENVPAVTAFQAAKSLVSSDQFSDMKDRVNRYIENRPSLANARFVTPKGTVFSPIVNNTIDINLNDMSSEEQGQTIRQHVADGIEEGLNRTFMNVQNNFPRVE